MRPKKAGCSNWHLYQKKSDFEHSHGWGFAFECFHVFFFERDGLKLTQVLPHYAKTWMSLVCCWEVDFFESRAGNTLVPMLNSSYLFDSCCYIRLNIDVAFHPRTCGCVNYHILWSSGCVNALCWLGWSRKLRDFDHFSSCIEKLHQSRWPLVELAVWMRLVWARQPGHPAWTRSFKNRS